MANQIRLNPQVEAELNELTIAFNNSASAIGNYLIKTGIKKLKEFIPQLDQELKESFHEVLKRELKPAEPTEARAEQTLKALEKIASARIRARRNGTDR